MRFLLDMGISPDVVATLRDLGHDAVHIHELGLGTLSDTEIMRLAIREGRTVITHDLDFANLLAASAASLPSVILFRLRNMRPERVMARLRVVITAHAADLEAGAVISVSELQVRMRHLPLDAS
jgi:predicted nuclease of predicted toxin-antitoxin system